MSLLSGLLATARGTPRQKKAKKKGGGTKSASIHESCGTLARFSLCSQQRDTPREKNNEAKKRARVIVSH